MRVLILTRVWPTLDNPHSGTWVRDQVSALESLDVDCDVLHVTDGHGIVPYIHLWRAMRSRLTSDDYDVIHAHYGFTGIVAATQRAIPTVVTFHGSDVLGRSFAGPYRRVFGIIEKRLSKLLARRIDHAIVVSPRMQEVLKAPRATVAPMGIDPTRFKRVSRERARSELGLHDSTPIAVFVGDPALKRKRFELAESAMTLARSQLPDAELLPVHGRDHDEVALYMNAADAMILTSYVEGSPTVVKEAMACDLPVITVPVGDVREQLEGVEPSFVLDADASALATGLLQLLRTPSRSNGRARIERYANERIAAIVANIYLEVRTDKTQG
jgi:teichuronic acid biosynthesis glycosyltransferase TuaC